MIFSKGYIVPKADEINEEFQICYKYIIANVQADNIKKVLLDFLETLEEPLFFILELPLSENEEKEFRKNENDPFHKAVYYIDGCTKKDIAYILEKSGDLLIDDGLSTFGFASHTEHSEIMIMRYNIVYILCNEIERYSSFFNNHGIKKVDKIKTAWDTFSKKCYGSAMRIESNGKTVYSLLDDYKAWGIYRSEIREG